jgi:ATP:cob(I)alamin adenosyltransferase
LALLIPLIGEEEMMGIYTKTGDKGQTSLFDGKRVKKYAKRVATYGTFDECSAQISVAEKLSESPTVRKILLWIMEKIFQLNAEIATSDNQEKLYEKSTVISASDISQLEQWIDDFLLGLPELHRFILPGATLAGAQLHVARTICRRGERSLVALNEKEAVRKEVLQFVNRLSDCLYVLARVEDQEMREKKIAHEVIKRYEASSEDCLANFQDLQEVFKACILEAQEIKVAVAIAMVDQHGDLIGSYRMPNSLLVAMEMSQKKAYSAVAMKQSTADLSQATQPGSDLYQLETLTNGRIVTFAGGIPLVDKQGKFLGGIGVSGGTIAEDQQIARAGIKKFEEIDDAG